jgi:hypothetical protein
LGFLIRSHLITFAHQPYRSIDTQYQLCLNHLNIFGRQLHLSEIDDLDARLVAASLLMPQEYSDTALGRRILIFLSTTLDKKGAALRVFLDTAFHF